MKGTFPSRGCGEGRESPSKCHEGKSKLHLVELLSLEILLLNALVLRGDYRSILPKNVFAVHGVDEAGKAVLIKPRVSRDQLGSLIAQLPPCIIGMEACSGAHYWGRAFQSYGRSEVDRAEVCRAVPDGWQARHGEHFSAQTTLFETFT